MNAKLEQAFDAVRALPEQDQLLIAEALLGDVADASRSQLSPEQRAIVTGRLSRPLDTVDPAEMDALWQRYLRDT